MSTSMRLSIDAPGSGHNGSVLCDRATGSSHWKPLSMNVDVSDCSVWVITLPMHVFLCSSVSVSCSKGLGIWIVWDFNWLFSVGVLLFVADVNVQAR